jgi:Pyruvate/2-oxoacid:ferredoxin oxidoreductase delta subunit
MTKLTRNIIVIDKEKCNGCGLCVNACAEGALKLVNGKAELVSETYCDGLGACIGECPQDAIKIIQKEADAFDEKAVQAHLRTEHKHHHHEKHHEHHGEHKCPGMKSFEIPANDNTPCKCSSGGGSQLTQWPVQLHLVPVQAPFWKDANILIAADCVPCAYPDFHQSILRGKKLIIACPKLDDTSEYKDKLAAIFASNDIRSITVAHMEVPCCTGLVNIAHEAYLESGKNIPFTSIKVGIKGQLKNS